MEECASDRILRIVHYLMKLRNLVALRSFFDHPLLVFCVAEYFLFTSKYAAMVILHSQPYRVSQEVGYSINSTVITSSNTGRFSKFFHCHTPQEVCNKAMIKYLTVTPPQMCRYIPCVTSATRGLLHYFQEIMKVLSTKITINR